MIERFAEQDLVLWLHKDVRKPLVLRGARQVGKSTLVREFARKNGLVLNEINLERHLLLDELFQTSNIPAICRELEVITGRNIQDRGNLLFLDEIQATPHALMVLRYLHEEMPEIPIIAAGSLLEFTLADHSFSMPVGRIHYYHLHPVSFGEFVNAMEPALVKYIQELTPGSPPPAIAHQKLLQLQQEFFCVGGMPEAIFEYQKNKSLISVQEVHRSIIDTYQDDFAKYARRNDLVLLQKVLAFIPRALGRKIKYAAIDKEQRSAKVKEAIDLLAKARVCHKVCHSHSTGVPLAAEANDSVYKLLFLDIGLTNHVLGLDWTALSRMEEQQIVNEGGLAEQFIGQHLMNISGGKDVPRLHYWLREGKRDNAEVDYVLSLFGKVVPVEVKSGKSGTLKSLHQFMHRRGLARAVRFDLNFPSEQNVTHAISTKKGVAEVNFTLISLPLYAVEELPRIMKSLGGE
ncbi:MAG: ATP-binding protein [Desulfovermiculus sp.]|nr:ATP-binding protein [Desulfovermiculus sp.]